MTKPKLLILLTVFIDVVGLGIIIPILPFYVGQFNSSPIVITALFSIFAICSFFSAPLIGSLSDKYGRRPLLIISLISTSIGWFIFAWAPSLLFLFIGRIIDGLAAGNFPVAQSYLVDLAKTDKERTQNLGLIGAMFGLGFIIGPALGGTLGGISHSLPFWIVGGMATINAILAFWFLPESRKVIHEHKAISFNPLRPLINAVKDQSRRKVYLAWFLFTSAVAIFQSILTLYLHRAFGWQELTVGLVFTITGVILVINQGFLMKKFWLKYFTVPKLNTALLALFAVGFLMMIIRPMYVFYLGLLFVTLGHSVLRVSLTSTASDNTVNHGEILGIMSAIMSLSAGIMPMLGGWAFDQKIALPFLVCAGLAFAGYVILGEKKVKASSTS